MASQPHQSFRSVRLSVERSNRSRLRRGPCTFLAHDQTRFTTWLCLGHQAFCQTKFWPGREAFRARASYQAFDSSSAQISDFPISQGLFRSVRPPSGGQTQFLGQTNGPYVCHLAQKLSLCLCATKGAHSGHYSLDLQPEPTLSTVGPIDPQARGNCSADPRIHVI